MSKNQKIKIRLKSYDHKILDEAAQKVVETAKAAGATVAGPIPLPTQKQIITILRAVHKYKYSREQFEIRTHKRLIEISNAGAKVIDAFMRMDIAAGVELEVKLNDKHN